MTFPPSRCRGEQADAPVRVDDRVGLGELAARLANRGNQQLGCRRSRLEERSGADPQARAGDDLVHHGVVTDADVGRHVEQLHVAFDDPSRSLPRRRTDAQADLTAAAGTR